MHRNLLLIIHYINAKNIGSAGEDKEAQYLVLGLYLKFMEKVKHLLRILFNTLFTGHTATGSLCY